MKPVYQTISNHNPEQEVYGDCFRACIASLLELPIIDVPHFVAEYEYVKKDNPDINWLKFVNEWLYNHGLAYMEFNVFPSNIFDMWCVKDLYHVISLPSPSYRGDVFHSVIGCNGKIVFDPQINSIEGYPSRSEWQYGFLIKLAN